MSQVPCLHEHLANAAESSNWLRDVFGCIGKYKKEVAHGQETIQIGKDKYDAFRPGSYGKLSNSEEEGKPYLFSILQTKSQWSSNTYMPYLKIVDEPHLDKDSMGQKLVYGDKQIVCENAAYLLRDDATEEVIEIIEIKQNDEGIDIEDRINVLKNYISLKIK